MCTGVVSGVVSHDDNLLSDGGSFTAIVFLCITHWNKRLEPPSPLNSLLLHARVLALGGLRTLSTSCMHINRFQTHTRTRVRSHAQKHTFTTC
jgi:hypothetical protein